MRGPQEDQANRVLTVQLLYRCQQAKTIVAGGADRSSVAASAISTDSYCSKQLDLETTSQGNLLLARANYKLQSCFDLKA